MYTMQQKYGVNDKSEIKICQRRSSDSAPVILTLDTTSQLSCERTAVLVNIYKLCGIQKKNDGLGTKRFLNLDMFHIKSQQPDILYLISISDSGNDYLMMKPGRYQYPFKFTLPSNCSTSFEGSVGRVRYYLHLTVDRPWAFDDEAKLPITVINLLDLNQEEQATVEYYLDACKCDFYN